MSQIRFHQVSLTLTEEPLFDQVSFAVNPGARLAVIGRNGAGKSSLLKLIQGIYQPDGGTIERETTHIACLEQTVPQQVDGNVYDLVATARKKEDDWHADTVIRSTIDKLGLDPDALVASLSGGQIRRALLARALVNEPDILLLDEPTNHLDISSIEWLEKYLKTQAMTVIFITHDRSFLENVATGVLDIDRGNIIFWHGTYSDFLQHKDQKIKDEERHNALFDKRLAQEEVWIRQGIKARRTRNEGRVRALEAMRQQRSQRRSQTGSLQLQSQSLPESGKQVLIAENLSITLDNKTLVSDFNCIIGRGDKIGILGPNGCGKSTLIRCLLGEIQPTSGQVQQGTRLSVAYFDQHRSQLNPNETLIDTVCPGSDMVTINGKDKHVISYLQDFLFTPEQARGRVKGLSGGESNRLLLAKLFAQPANLLVLDEPTNDLDMDSLELLEEHLATFDGTILLITHDRSLLNNVVTSTWVFGEQGSIIDYVGGYDEVCSALSPIKAVSAAKKSSPGKSSPKLSQNERKELNRLPKQIEKLEQKIKKLHDTMAQDDFYSRPPSDVDATTNALQDHESTLKNYYARWESLLEKE